MSISKSAFSLSKDEYEGTGKRLFIGLVIGTAILLCLLLLLIWLVPTIGFAAIHPWLPFIAGIVFGGAILGILWLSVGLVLHAYTGKPILGTSRLRGITIRLLLPIMELTYGVQVAIATGGTIARRIVVQARPKRIVAVACERDLSSGIQDTHPLPVFGVINERPNGPCLDTFVSIRRLESAIRHFIGIE